VLLFHCIGTYRVHIGFFDQRFRGFLVTQVRLFLKHCLCVLSDKDYNFINAVSNIRPYARLFSNIEIRFVLWFLSYAAVSKIMTTITTPIVCYGQGNRIA